MTTTAATRRALADVVPGDRITRYRSARTGTWHDTRPLLVLSPIAPVWHGGPDGVRVHHHLPTEVEHVLYPDAIDEVEVVHSRGYATRDAATAAARKAAGWAVRGGHYYRPDAAESARCGWVAWSYAGFQGVDLAGDAFVKWGWIVQAGGRWHVTARPGAWAAKAAARMAVTPAHLAVAAANGTRGSMTRTVPVQYVGA